MFIKIIKVEEEKRSDVKISWVGEGYEKIGVRSGEGSLGFGVRKK